MEAIPKAGRGVGLGFRGLGFRGLGLPGPSSVVPEGPIG